MLALSTQRIRRIPRRAREAKKQKVSSQTTQFDTHVALSCLLPYLRACDIVNCIQVCKKWCHNILEGIHSWCMDLVTFQQGFIPGHFTLEYKRANCYLQLLELYKRRRLHETDLIKFKQLLCLKDPELVAYNGSRDRHFGPLPPIPSLGIEDINKREPVWFHHLNSLSYEFQVNFLHERCTMLSVPFVSAVEHQVSLKLIFKKWWLFNHHRQPNPSEIDALVDLDYLLELFYKMKKKFRNAVAMGPMGLYKFPFVFNPLQIRHYLPFLLTLCKSRDFGGVDLYPELYKGGLTNDELELLRSACNR
jgi:hypothetical protein